MKNEVNKEYTTNLEALTETGEPPLYAVVVHNDDFTPMEFVVGILEKFFFMDRQQAAQTMLEAHTNGKAACGIFSKDYAESKIVQVIEYAHTHEHPLHCSMEVA
ncbi:ATP-dependent Clp protease adapter protein ClpS [Aquicella siphonis]|uniref:ATP-dependent Clp protease adapter protein ClpS n=1 Tax=Aquicella siphonis TaxID=254247 RepID=A0A5E4PIM8_9COXI|nr:ATP-dependent Clp protease adapter ClpS [Aquicella siphonis]VVC76156.1 ATP-dependent Clp protease adapter protein ClpS [Aquicella siphonis]